MSIQIEILADVVNKERVQAFSPAEEKHRRAARLLAELQCCLRAPWSSRLLAAFRGKSSACCVAA